MTGLARGGTSYLVQKVAGWTPYHLYEVVFDGLFSPTPLLYRLLYGTSPAGIPVYNLSLLTVYT